MERERRREMIEGLDRLYRNGGQRGAVLLFAHCNATLELADELMRRGIVPSAILDNNPDKHRLSYSGIPVCPPEEALRYSPSVVLIVSRFYEQMAGQLRSLGYQGEIEKLVDYNPYVEYSLSPDTLIRKGERVKRGVAGLWERKRRHAGDYLVFCPFPALGDVYLCMSYLKHYLMTISRMTCTVFVVGNGCAEVAGLFGYAAVEKLRQDEMDDIVQGVIYTDDPECYIAHQDILWLM